MPIFLIPLCEFVQDRKRLQTANVKIETRPYFFYPAFQLEQSMTSDGDLFRKEFEEKVKDFYKKKYRQAYIGSD